MKLKYYKYLPRVVLHYHYCSGRWKFVLECLYFSHRFCLNHYTNVIRIYSSRTSRILLSLIFLYKFFKYVTCASYLQIDVLRTGSTSYLFLIVVSITMWIWGHTSSRKHTFYLLLRTSLLNLSVVFWNCPRWLIQDIICLLFCEVLVSANTFNSILADLCQDSVYERTVHKPYCNSFSYFPIVKRKITFI